MTDTTVNDEVEHRVSEVTKGGLKLGFLHEFPKVDFEDAEGFDVGEVCEPFESSLVFGFVGWGVAQPLGVL